MKNGYWCLLLAVSVLTAAVLGRLSAPVTDKYYLRDDGNGYYVIDLWHGEWFTVRPLKNLNDTHSHLSKILLVRNTSRDRWANLKVVVESADAAGLSRIEKER